jgi:hypothetical protein
MKNLQHCSDARAQVVHRNSNPVVIAQTLKVDGALKRNFKSKTRDKEGIELLRERERRGLRHLMIGISSNKKMNTYLP